MFSHMKAIPLPIQKVLELFTTSLAEVRFADVDGPTLLRLATEVEAAAELLTAAQAALDAATPCRKQDALLQQTQRALAYARVYAENDEGLSAQLDAVGLPACGAPIARGGSAGAVRIQQPSPRPRGRPRKAVVAGPTLEAMLVPAE